MSASSSSFDPRLEALASAARRRPDRSAELGLVLLGVLVSVGIATWAFLNPAPGPLVGVLVASALLAVVCGIAVVHGAIQEAPPEGTSPLEVLVERERRSLQAELRMWRGPAATVVPIAGVAVVLAAAVVGLPMLMGVELVLGSLFLATLLVAPFGYLAWGRLLRVPRLQEALRRLEAAEG